MVMARRVHEGSAITTAVICPEKAAESVLPASAVLAPIPAVAVPWALEAPCSDVTPVIGPSLPRAIDIDTPNSEMLPGGTILPDIIASVLPANEVEPVGAPFPDVFPAIPALPVSSESVRADSDVVPDIGPSLPVPAANDVPVKFAVATVPVRSARLRHCLCHGRRKT